MRCHVATFLTGAALWLAAGTLPGLAGPWARGAGEAFLSFSVSAQGGAAALSRGDGALDRYASLYGEYGLGHGLTLGAQVGRGETPREGALFLRYTLTGTDAPWQIALDGGVGLRVETATADRRFLRLGVAIGRGFGGMDRPRWWLPLRHEGGWVALDVIGMLDVETREPTWQAEATLGLALSDRLRVMLTLKTEEWPGSAPIHSLTPSAAWALSDRVTAQLGVRMGLGADTDVSPTPGATPGLTLGLTLGLWHSF